MSAEANANDDEGIQDGETETGIEAVRLVTIAVGFDNKLDIQVDPGVELWMLKGMAVDLLDMARQAEANEDDRQDE